VSTAKRDAAEELEAGQAREAVERLVSSIERVVRGKDEVVRLVVTALVARGHVLIEDVPGVGKTTLAAALSRSVGASFHRVQFTSDLMPSDILGVNIWNREARTFEFRPGPIFAHLVLADEINRATPKTQSALLEAMSDGTVSVDDRVHALPDPFLVLATQNPLEHAGTYPLPDSQLDRFLMRVRMGYPSPDVEAEILRAGGRERLEDLAPVLSLAELLALRDHAAAVAVHDDLVAYIVAVVAATRDWEVAEIGASPRASLDLLAAVRARAWMDGREHAIPDDVKALAGPVLAHRIVTRHHGLDSRRVETLLAALVDQVPVPL